MKQKNNIAINKDLKSATRQIVDVKIILYLFAALVVMTSAFVMDLNQEEIGRASCRERV